MDRERFYAHLPVALQNMALSVEGWRVRRRRFNAEYHQLVTEYDSRSFWSTEQIAAYRDSRLTSFVAHAVATTPYYRELFSRLRLNAADIRTLADLAAIPVLTKAEVQETPERFRSDAVRSKATMPVHTSGSTGGGLRFPVTLRGHREQWAVWERYHRWHGLRFDTPCLYFGGRSIVPASQRRPPYWRYNRVTRQTMFSAYHLSPETAPAYLAAMRQVAAGWIHGYPSFVALIANYALQLGQTMPMQYVTLGAENVLPAQSDAIERAFGVRPIQHYGMAEGVANISECPQGQLHVDEDFAATEFLPDEAASDGGCDVVGVNFSNPAYPLLRYHVGDKVTMAGGDATCDCGRPGRIVLSIDGRQEDYIVTRRGAKIGRLDHIFKDMVNVREAQLYQSTPGTMTIRIVKGDRYAEADEQLLREEVEKRIGQEVSFDIEYVASLPRTARGKLRFVVADLK